MSWEDGTEGDSWEDEERLNTCTNYNDYEDCCEECINCGGCPMFTTKPGGDLSLISDKWVREHWELSDPLCKERGTQNASN